MGNMRGWGGPLPYPTWYQSQLALQHKILNRMRDFGMIPVLPGFAGHVPAAIKSLYPSAKILRLGDWGRFNSTYCCTYFLDPSDSLFQVRIFFTGSTGLTLWFLSATGSLTIYASIQRQKLPIPNQTLLKFTLRFSSTNPICCAYQHFTG